jgi:general secretion pathway protein K
MKKYCYKTIIKITKSQKGIALILVLWVLIILMTLVLSFTLLVKTEVNSTIYFKEGIEKKFYAEAGIQRAILEIFYNLKYKGETIEFEETKAWRTDGTPYDVEIGDGYFSVRITDESGKVDINTTPEIILRNLLINLGVSQDDTDIIVDSIMDWKDSDDLYRLHGAESDYYMSLPNPYKAKNAPFDTVEELLLVKGVTPSILYGDNERKGLIDFITVHSNKNTINIKSAPKEVLASIPGMTPELADAIIEFRQYNELEDPSEIESILGENFAIFSKYVDTMDSDTFTIESSGYKSSTEPPYTIKATVTLVDDKNYNYLYYKSPVYKKE